MTTLLTPQDPRSVDFFSDKEILLTGDKEPYLLGLVLDQQGKAIRTPSEAEPFAEHLLTSKYSTRDVDQDGTKKTAAYVMIKMAANLSQKQAEKYRPVVQQFAEQYKISPSLVFAIIRTESNFNPYAVSSAPAYGLMQLVPTSGGREAYRRAKGQDIAPSRDYLFDPSNFITPKVKQILDKTREGLDKLEIQTDQRIFPVEISCARCNHSLMDPDHLVDYHPSIRVTISFERKHGWLRLSSLYGSYNIESEYEIPEDTVVNFFCPHCHTELRGAANCVECGSPMVPMIVKGGGVIQICSKRGCKGHMLDLSGGIYG